MDGLECSEVNYKEILEDSYSARLDSDYYKKDVMAFAKVSNDWELLSAICPQIKSGTTPKERNDELKEGIILFKTNDIRNNIQSIESAEQYYYIDVETDKRMSTSSIQGKDVLINIVGATTEVIGRVSFVPENFGKANITQAMARLRVETNDVLPEYLFVFLLSSFAKIQTKRIARQTGQYNMNLIETGSFRIWKPSKQFQKYIARLVSQSNKLMDNGINAYKMGELLLSENLSITTINKNKAFAVNMFSESYLMSGRLDAEYYQPKYDALFKALAKISTKILGGKNGIVDMMKSIEPGSEAYVDEGIPFIRVSDMSKYEITESEIKLDPKVIPSPEKLFPKKDTILFSKDGSVGIAYKVEDDMSVITSGALLHLTVRDTSEVLPDYLTLVLNSPVVQLQAERDTNGAIIQHWKPSEIEKVLIPILDMDIQEDIAQKVQESFALRKKSKELLEYAKQAVEMAIEQGEDEALLWLENKGIKG